MNRYFRKIYEQVINPAPNEALAQVDRELFSELPVFWLLGKTGAGKSSFVQRITGADTATIGNGFQPCTQHSYEFDFPQERPIARFLDTRGLGEAGYELDAELALLANVSHAIIVLARVNDPSQNAVTTALKGLQKFGRRSICLIHTHCDEPQSERELERLWSLNQHAFEEAWGGPIPSCKVDLSDPNNPDLAGGRELEDLLITVLPETQIWLQDQGVRDSGSAAFSVLKAEIIGYASAAAATDTLPLAGLVTVPVLQGKMLHSIAARLGSPWNRDRFSDFSKALGTSILAKYAVYLAGRQLAKLIPVWGQTAGAAFAASVSFATTYALGRAAVYYLRRRQAGQPIDENELREIYTTALRRANAADGGVVAERAPDRA